MKKKMGVPVHSEELQWIFHRRVFDVIFPIDARTDLNFDARVRPYGQLKLILN